MIPNPNFSINPNRNFVLKTLLNAVMQEQDFILLDVDCGYLFNIGICNNRKQSLRRMGAFEVLGSNMIHKSKKKDGAAAAGGASKNDAPPRHWANVAWRRILD